MDIDTGPPKKRRRLLDSIHQAAPSPSDLQPIEPTPILPRQSERQYFENVPTATQAAPARIQEIHWHIQQKSVVGAREAKLDLRRRQEPAILSTITTIDVNGNPVVTTFTVGDARATTTLPTTSSEVTSVSEQTPSGSTPDSTDNGNATSIGTTSGGGVTQLTISDNSTSIPKTTQQRKTTQQASQRTSSHTSRKASTYLATLSNDHVVTVTRSKKPYVTTFTNGETSTICDQQNHCQMVVEQTRSTRSTSDGQMPSSSIAPSDTTTAFVALTTTNQAPTSSSTTPSGSATQSHGSDSTPPAGTIAGGVVGGAAGLAVVLLIALVFLRWYKRRMRHGHHALPPSSTISPEPDQSRGAGMAERAGLTPLVTAVPAFFRHQNRSQEGPPSGERGFTKISGRKLPSAWSEGMSTGEPSRHSANTPLTGQERNLSSHSFYRDSNGFYGGEGVPTDRSVSPQDLPTTRAQYDQMTLSPGPQRTPTVHTGGPYVMSPSSSAPHAPNLQSVAGSPPGPAPVYARSSTPSTLPDNRSSRFTEEV